MHSKAGMHLKSRDTSKQNHLLFTRVSLKPVFYCFFPAPLCFSGSPRFFRLPSVLPAPVCFSGSRPFFRLPSLFPAPVRSSGSRLLFRLPSVLPTPVRFCLILNIPSQFCRFCFYLPTCFTAMRPIFLFFTRPIYSFFATRIMKSEFSGA